MQNSCNSQSMGMIQRQNAQLTNTQLMESIKSNGCIREIARLFQFLSVRDKNMMKIMQLVLPQLIKLL